MKTVVEHFDPQGAAWSETNCAAVMAALQAHMDYLRAPRRRELAAKRRRDVAVNSLCVDGRRLLTIIAVSTSAHMSRE